MAFSIVPPQEEFGGARRDRVSSDPQSHTAIPRVTGSSRLTQVGKPVLRLSSSHASAPCPARRSRPGNQQARPCRAGAGAASLVPRRL